MSHLVNRELCKCSGSGLVVDTDYFDSTRISFIQLFRSFEFDITSEKNSLVLVWTRASGSPQCLVVGVGWWVFAHRWRQPRNWLNEIKTGGVGFLKKISNIFVSSL